MKRISVGLALLVGVAVWLCFGQGCHDMQSCKAMGSVAAASDASVQPGSQLINPSRAFDGLLGSYASLQAGSGSGGGIRGTMAGGRVISGKRRAGVLLTAPSDGQPLRVSIATYLNGKVQDQGNPQAPVYGSSGELCGSGCESRGGMLFYGIETELPFNAIEVNLQVAGASEPLQIRELCHQ